MKSRQVLDDDDVGREAFDRSPATWERLGAPAALYDVAAAAAAWNGYAPAGWRLDGFPEHPARQILAHRHWQWARPAFLAAVGALTAREAELLERWRNSTRGPPGHSGPDETHHEKTPDPVQDRRTVARERAAAATIVLDERHPSLTGSADLSEAS